MKPITVIAVCIALNVTYARLAFAEQPQAGSTAAPQDSATPGEEVHFVSVLTFDGEIVAVDPAKRLVTLKGPNGEVLKLEAEREGDLTARKVGDHVVVRYFEGGQIGKEKAGGAAPVQSLKDGMLEAAPGGRSGRHRAVAASVERVDAANQEITLKGPDGSLETILVTNPENLSNVEVGDRVVVTRPQGLALSVQSEA